MHPEEILKTWIATMYARDISPAYRKRYFNKIHSLYLDFNNAHKVADDPFDKVKKHLEMCVRDNSETTAANVKALNKGISRLVLAAETRPAVCALLYMLYTGTFDFQHVINLKIEDYPQYPAQLKHIVAIEKLHHRRKYVFDLRQSQKRNTQLTKQLSIEMENALTAIGLKFPGGFSSESLKSIWIAKAISCNISFRDIRAAVNEMPPEYSYLSLMSPSVLTNREREDMIQTVANSINNVAPRWHAMRLRRGVAPEEIKNLLKSENPRLYPSIDFFYPVSKTARREKKKIVFDEVPFLPDILFFKIQNDRIAAIFKTIASKAWIYHNTNNPDSPYAVIPDREMRIFQKCVQQFTPDMQIAISGHLPLEKGRKVHIIAGEMKGYEGVIHDVTDNTGTPTGCRILCLRISTDNCIRWTANIEEPFIVPVD